MSLPNDCYYDFEAACSFAEEMASSDKRYDWFVIDHNYHSVTVYKAIPEDEWELQPNFAYARFERSTGAKLWDTELGVAQ